MMCTRFSLKEFITDCSRNCRTNILWCA